MSSSSDPSAASPAFGCDTPVRLPPVLPPEPCCCNEDPLQGFQQLFVDYLQGSGMGAGRDPATRPVSRECTARRRDASSWIRVRLRRKLGSKLHLTNARSRNQSPKCSARTGLITNPVWPVVPQQRRGRADYVPRCL